MVGKTIKIHCNTLRELINDKSLYNVIIVPHVIYCIDNWGKACKIIKSLTNPKSYPNKSYFYITEKKLKKYLFYQLISNFYKLVDYKIVQVMNKAQKCITFKHPIKYVKREIYYNLKRARDV